MLEDLKAEVKELKRTLLLCCLITVILLIGWLFMFWEVVCLNAENDALRKANNFLIGLQTDDYIEPELPLFVEEEYQEVYFTNYYEGDGSSTNRVGANTPDGKERLTTDYFEVNENGWYTYDGKVVCATATTNGLESNYGVLALYNEEVEGIKYYTYHDEIEFEFNGIRYEAIVLDTCSSSHSKEWLNTNAEGLNLIDIFVVDKEHSFGKAKGKIYVN